VIFAVSAQDLKEVEAATAANDASNVIERLCAIRGTRRLELPFVVLITRADELADLPRLESSDSTGARSRAARRQLGSAARFLRQKAPVFSRSLAQHARRALVVFGSVGFPGGPRERVRIDGIDRARVWPHAEPWGVRAAFAWALRRPPFYELSTTRLQRLFGGTDGH
jgi:hypothetical protein